jgi:hypothetical protein
VLNIIFFILIIIILIIILIFTYNVYNLLKNKFILSDKDKEFIIFTIDMYLRYGEELDIIPEDKHEIIVENLTNIKNKINNAK